MSTLRGSLSLVAMLALGGCSSDDGAEGGTAGSAGAASADPAPEGTGGGAGSASVAPSLVEDPPSLSAMETSLCRVGGLFPLDEAELFSDYAGVYAVATSTACSTGSVAFTADQPYAFEFDETVLTVRLAHDGGTIPLAYDGENGDGICTNEAGGNIVATIVDTPIDEGAGMQPSHKLDVNIIGADIMGTSLNIHADPSDPGAAPCSLAVVAD